MMLPLPADPFRRLTLLAHESFHRIQPSLGLSASDAPDPSLDTEAGRLWLRLELRALARALRSTGVIGRKSAVDAMVFRMYRDRLCPGTAAMEAAMEKQEGLAEYTGVFIALRETGEDIGREARPWRHSKTAIRLRDRSATLQVRLSGYSWTAMRLDGAHGPHPPHRSVLCWFPLCTSRHQKTCNVLRKSARLSTAPPQ